MPRGARSPGRARRRPGPPRAAQRGEQPAERGEHPAEQAERRPLPARLPGDVDDQAVAAAGRHGHAEQQQQGAEQPAQHRPGRQDRAAAGQPDHRQRR
jgi:hypothetical protein